MLDPVVLELLEAAPEFADRYLELVGETDDDPGPAAAFTELAEFVAGLVLEVGGCPPALGRCLAAVEAAAASEDGAELVAWAFLDCLSPADRRRVAPFVGARTRALLAEIGDDEPGSAPP